MGKPLRAFRFPVDVYNSFKKVAGKNGYTVTGAFTRFMMLCADWDMLVFPEKPGGEGLKTEVNILLNWIENERFWYNSASGEEVSAEGRLLQLLPKVEDKSLLTKIERALKKT